jgi:hypothetical protein
MLAGKRQAVMTRHWDEKSKMKIWRCATQGLCAKPHTVQVREKKLLTRKKLTSTNLEGEGIGKVKFGEVMWSFISSSP